MDLLQARLLLFQLERAQGKPDRLHIPVGLQPLHRIRRGCRKRIRAERARWRMRAWGEAKK